MHTLLQNMNMGRLFVALLAFALLFAPISIAEASAPMAGQQPMMEQGGHCVMAPTSSAEHHGAARKTCCSSTNMAVAPAQAGSQAGELLQHAPLLPAVATARLPFLDEIATPPPRHC